ncbi:hypothetical protein EJB05_42341, partial [Eragrostis curvula]
MLVPDHDDDARWAAELAFEVSDIIGRGREKEEVTRLISGSNGALRVAAVWGMGGMGKSSLVRMVHNDPVLLDEFDCGAWVTVRHPLDIADVWFRRRLGKEMGLALDQNVQDYLRDKRYLVIVDDLLDTDEWENIWHVFPRDNCKGSRIIVTTRREDVARHCAGHAADGHGHVYELRPLGEAESMDLLCRKKLRYLETLDIQDTKVTRLPDGIANLRSYVIFLPCKCTRRNGEVKKLAHVGMVDVGQGNGVAGKLRKLTNLRRLGVTGFNEEEGQELWKSIGKLNRLQRLENALGFN